ncbi:hypothetical protein QE357_000677 [Siphonobacter sp. BAB-5404]|nr:hypothetical protein [Siphonobacter sp. SORGH_AS_1065]MDR6193625.1 hypothetical protein [Siphonobacter sp. SORGH_AS_0500]
MLSAMVGVRTNYLSRVMVGKYNGLKYIFDYS